MGKIAVVFSGQGAQKTGMGRDIYDRYSVARDIFDEAESIVPGIADMCFSGSAEVLNRTVNTQPCVFTVSLAAAAVLKENGVEPAAVAGFSLGEMSALTFAGAFSFADGLKVVLERARLMDGCAEKNQGAMAAVLKLTDERVVELCERTGTFAVNFNCPLQVSVAGERERLAQLTALVAEHGGRVVPLAVSGAFHSPYMREAGEAFFDVISSVKIAKPTVAVYSNTTARPFTDIPAQCASQIYSPVLWQKTIENMCADGIESFVETGPGEVLSGMIRKIGCGK